MMSDSFLHRARILQVPEGVPRPFWSVMIPTYNCASYLRATLASVLAQDLGPEIMQIEVVDDCSTQDDPKAVVEELGGGRVSFYRQSENVGYIKNFETCLQRSRGHLIHLLHGDDYVRNGFYCKLQQAFEANLQLGAAFCRHFYMNEEGHWLSISPLETFDSGMLDGWLEKIAAGQRLVTPSVVVRRDVYEHLGGFDRRFSCAGEDWEMWVRIAAHYPVWFETEPLAAYRMKRTGSLTESTASVGRMAQDMRLAVEIIESYLPNYLPEPLAKQVTNQARQMYAGWALEVAEQLSVPGNLKAFIAQIQEVFKCSTSQSTFRLVIRLLWRKGMHWIKYILRLGLLPKRQQGIRCQDG